MTKKLKISKASLTLLVLCYFLLPADSRTVFPYESSGQLVDLDSKKTQKQELLLYELADDGVKPDEDEFYLSTIYGSTYNARALIKRSNNNRAGDLYNQAVEYKVGDKLTKEYGIVEINFQNREVIVKNIYTREYFALKLSYGSAKSSLVKKFNYVPKKRHRRLRRPKATSTNIQLEDNDSQRLE